MLKLLLRKQQSCSCMFSNLHFSMLFQFALYKGNVLLHCISRLNSLTFV